MSVPAISERRQSPRVRLACPAKLVSSSGQLLVQTKTVDISDGGALLPVRFDELPPIGSAVRVDFSVPRFTTNTYMLEPHTVEARVLRHQPLKDDRYAATAVQFEKRQPLSLQD